MVLPVIALGVVAATLSLFCALCGWALIVARNADRGAVLLDPATRSEYVRFTAGYDSVTLKQHTGSSLRSSSGKVGKTLVHALDKMARQGWKAKAQPTHRMRDMRIFHRSIVASYVALVAAAYVLYYITSISQTLYTTRSPDALLVDPAYWVVSSLGAGALGGFVAVALQHTGLFVTLVGVAMACSRLLFALMTLQNTTLNMYMCAIASVLAILYVLYRIYFARTRAIAGTSTLVGVVTVLAIPLSYLVHSCVAIVGYDLMGWFAFEATVIVRAAYDIVFVLLPALYVICDGYYKNARAWPLLPYAVYAEYGLGEYWLIEARPEYVAEQHEVRLLETAMGSRKTLPPPPPPPGTDDRRRQPPQQRGEFNSERKANARALLPELRAVPYGSNARGTVDDSDSANDSVADMIETSVASEDRDDRRGDDYYYYEGGNVNGTTDGTRRGSFAPTTLQGVSA